MKCSKINLLVAFSFVFSLKAIACPIFNGAYTCQDTQGSQAFVISVGTKSSTPSIYRIKMGDQETLTYIADSVPRRCTENSNFQFVTSCFQGSLDIKSWGTQNIEELIFEPIQSGKFVYQANIIFRDNNFKDIHKQ